MKKRIFRWLIPMMLLLVLCGCSKEENKNQYQIYYMNMDATKVSSISYSAKNTDEEKLAMELLSELSNQPDSSKLRQTIPDAVKVVSCKRNGYMFVVDFNEEYYKMSATEEVLARAAIVRTLTQIKDVTYVMITVDGEPLTDKKGNTVGSMEVDDFVENPGEQINTSVKTTLTLYFADSDGTGLVKEERVVRYSSNIALEKLVVEQLIDGPTTSGLQQTIPSGTELITITVADDICYVDLDERFKNQDYTITEPVVLYSIVNSLTELQGIDKVQLSINGDTKGKCRFNYDLSTLYEANHDYVEE